VEESATEVTENTEKHDKTEHLSWVPLSVPSVFSVAEKALGKEEIALVAGFV
jgi:hypothetical protein